MERREGISSSGVTVVGSDAPSDYHVAPRTDTATHFAPPPQPLTVFEETAVLRKKIGRPRKYGPDGSEKKTKALSPMFFSSSQKRGKVRVSGSGDRELKPELLNLGDLASSSVGANFTPHIIIVNSGEDVTMKVISFSQQGPRAICVLSANGVISSVTLRQPDSSGGTLTYEGRFDILSLSGSFMPTDTGGPTRSRSGGLSVSLASPDGRILGGGVAGFLVAAGPVQVVVGSFVAASEHEAQKPKKQKPVAEPYSTTTCAPQTEEQLQSSEVPPDPTKIKFMPSSSSFNWSLPSDSAHRHPNIDITLPRK